jgi:hypothetical protein
MRTNTHPQDYNNGRYAVQGEELAEMNRRKAKLEQVKAQLIQIIGSRGYREFEGGLPMYVQTNVTLLTAEIEHELDHYECGCNPAHEPCQGCQNRYAVKES